MLQIQKIYQKVVDYEKTWDVFKRFTFLVHNYMLFPRARLIEDFKNIFKLTGDSIIYQTLTNCDHDT